MAKKVSFMCTAFRDGFQSVYGARVLTKDFLPAVQAARDAGITYFESGGGARFQSLYFYCNEDAFDMMDAFREVAGPDANLQTLSRGVNVVGLEAQPEDIIDLHAKLFKKHGVTTIRNFDALNDVNNLIHSGKSIVKHGLKHQVCVTLMELPPGCSGAHTAEFYADTLKKILAAGIPYDSVCFKDASGTAVPSKVYETIKLARKLLPAGTMISFHSHETAGIGVTAYKAAIEAGADSIDLSMRPVSGGTCQPDILTMWHALRGSDYELDVDIDKVRVAEDVFMDCMKDYFLPPEATAVEPLIAWSPMPGGALTANTQMLRDNNLMGKYSEVIKAMSEVVARGGFGTSVTPVSQFYFQQAFNNVMFGPWKKCAEGYGKMVLGYFGKTPVPADAEIIKFASEQLKLEPTTKLVVDIENADTSKGVEANKKVLRQNNLPETEENIFISACCEGKGIAFLQGKATVNVRKNEKVAEAAKAPAAAADKAAGGNYSVNVNGKPYNVVIEGDKVMVNGKGYSVSYGAAAAAPAMGIGGVKERVAVTAHLPGQVLRLEANVGDHVEEGDVIMVLEAMKMETEVEAPKSGKLAEILVSQGQQVNGEDVLAYIE